jgi:3-oxoacyl-(acyl-carrier-protein) synthase
MCGYRIVRAGRVHASVVVACDVLCPEAIDDLLALDALSSGTVAPYDRHAAGAGIGSAAVAILIERSDASLNAKRHPYGRVVGGAAVGDDVRHNGLPTQSADWRRCLRLAISNGNVDAGAIDLVVGAANGVASLDMAEVEAVAAVLPHAPFVTAPKALLGECRGTDGLIGVVAGLYSATQSSIPPSPGLIEPIASDTLRFAQPDRGLPAQLSIFAVTAASPGNNHAAVLVAP